MPPRIAILLCVCLGLWAGEDWKPAPGITVQPDGRITAGGLTLELAHWDDTWRRSGPPKAVKPAGALRDGIWHLDEPWAAPVGMTTLHQSVRSEGKDAVRIEASLESPPPTKAFALAIALDGKTYRGRELLIDGKPLALPAESPLLLRAGSPAKMIAIPSLSGPWLEISGDLIVMVQDNRSLNSDSFSVRVNADAKLHLAAVLRIRPGKPE